MSASSEPNGKDVRGLGAYRGMRDADSTPEPMGSEQRGIALGQAPRFVVQKHAAQKLHYDVRLEIDGVLESWALPRRPSLDPAKKRLAIHVEPHPVEYATFEGVIPKGNYGAGEVIIWDRGLWVPLDDPVQGLRDGKLLFELKGYKLRGTWTLVRTKRRGEKSPSKEWLLIKKPDDYADPHGQREVTEDSVLSGLTLGEVRNRAEREREVCAALKRAGVPQKNVDLAKQKPMLCQTADTPFSRPGWIFELKYDGFRMLVKRDDDTVQMRYRSGIDATPWFPDLVASIRSLPFHSFVLDAEVVVLADDGHPDFNRLQQRSMLGRTTDIERAMYAHPATLAVFDLLGLSGYDLRKQPLLARKKLLRTMLPTQGPLRYVDHIDERGEEFFAAVAHMGLEGVVAKKADSLYLGRRSQAWLKLLVKNAGKFAICGYTPSRSSRKDLGALLLAVRDGDTWSYAGRVGSGLHEGERDFAKSTLDKLPPWQPPFEGPAIPGAKWIEPHLVCRVRYKDWRAGMHLRHPTFVEFLPDDAAKSCTLASVHRVHEPVAPPDIVDDGLEKSESLRVELSNTNKVFWPAPDAGGTPITKGDLIRYYCDIAPYMLGYLKDRPVVLTRYPDGIHGKSFFQKNAPDSTPRWVRTEMVWSEHAKSERKLFVAANERTLAYLANLGTIPLHIWHSRIGSLERPDWCSVDLDPKGAPFADVVECARAVRRLCNQIDLPCFAKTSGSTGIHVLVPLGRQYTYEQSRTLAHLLCKVVETRLPDISTTAHRIASRKGKVYLDWGQNGHGRLLVAPYSVRAIAGATVSTPLRWREVNQTLNPARFTVRTVVKRMRRMKGDPMLAVLDVSPDLSASLEKLSRLLLGSVLGGCP